mgnify:CR=1 FL=1
MEVGLKGGDKLKAKLEELSRGLKAGAYVKVGFLAGATYPDGTSVAMVAVIQNFGAPSVGIPPRPYFSNMIAKESPHWGDDVAAALKAFNYDAESTMKAMGEQITGELRQSIVDTNDPPLSPVTLLLRQRFWGNPDAIQFSDVQQARDDVAKGTKAKVTGSQGKPLVWSGHLLNSVDSEVGSGKP